MPSLFAALSAGRLRARAAAAGKKAVERDSATQAPPPPQQQQQPTQPTPQQQPAQQQQSRRDPERVQERHAPDAGAAPTREEQAAPGAAAMPPTEHGAGRKGLLGGLSLRGLRKGSQAGGGEPAAREALPAPSNHHKANLLSILSGSSFRAKTKRSAAAAAAAAPPAPVVVPPAASEPGAGTPGAAAGAAAGAGAAGAGAAGAAGGGAAAATATTIAAAAASAPATATAAAAATSSSFESLDAPIRVPSSASLRGKGASAAGAGVLSSAEAVTPKSKRKGARAAVKAFSKLLGLGGGRSKQSEMKATAAAGSRAIEEEETDDSAGPVEEGETDPSPGPVSPSSPGPFAEQLASAGRADEGKKALASSGDKALASSGDKALASSDEMSPKREKRKGARAAVKAFTKLLGLGGGRSKRSDTEASAAAGSQAIDEEEEEEDGSGADDAEPGPEPPAEQLASAERDKDGKIPLAFASRLLALLPEGGRAGHSHSDSDIGELSQQPRVAGLAACLFDKSRGRVVNPYAAEAAWKEAWADPTLRVSFHVVLAAAVAHVIEGAARADGALLLPYGDASVNSAEDLLEKLPPAMVRLLERTRRALPTLESAGFVEWATPRLLGSEAAPDDLRTLLAATRQGSDSDSSNEDEDDDEEGEGEGEEEQDEEEEEAEGAATGVSRGAGPFEAIALAEFIPNKKTDIQLQVGERLRVLKVYGDGWCLGEQLSTGRQGEFPTSHIRREDAASTACARGALESVLSASGAQPGSAQALALLREIALSLDSALEAQVPLRQLVMT